MKIEFKPGERAVVARNLGLSEDASDAELGRALQRRVTTSESGEPVEASEYPPEWLTETERADLQKATKS